MNDLRVSLNQKAHNGEIDHLKLESMPTIHRRRNWYLNAHTSIQKDLLMNADGRYECPRDYCGKTYKEASSLQRHIRCVFPKSLNFRHAHNLNTISLIPKKKKINGFYCNRSTIFNLTKSCDSFEFLILNEILIGPLIIVFAKKWLRRFLRKIDSFVCLFFEIPFEPYSIFIIIHFSRCLLVINTAMNAADGRIFGVTYAAKDSHRALIWSVTRNLVSAWKAIYNYLCWSIAIQNADKL